MDTDRLTEIITEEIRRFFEESEGAAGDETVCECPRPATSGPSIQDGGGVKASEAPGHAPQAGSSFTGPKVLCLIHGEIEQKTEFLTALQDWSLNGITVEALISDPADRMELEKRGVRILSSASRLGERRENLKSYRAVLLPGLDRTFAAKTALGISDGELGEVTFSALFYRVPVLAAQDRLLTKSQTAHGSNLPGMADKIAQYRADLERMGVVIVPMKEMLSRVRYNARIATPGSGEVITHVITQEDARNLPGPVVRVARGGLVTAMARELLTQRGIEIQIVES
jgi:hypothetical protein